MKFPQVVGKLQRIKKAICKKCNLVVCDAIMSSQIVIGCCLEVAICDIKFRQMPRVVTASGVKETAAIWDQVREQVGIKL